MGNYFCNAQCTIPNGDFEDFSVRTGGGLGPVVVDYLYPDGGWDEIIPNIVSRAISGEGFFYRYEGSDANGYALELKRGNSGGIPVNGGLNRFECSDVSKKITGRYKFSGSSLPGITDTFLIAAYYNEIDSAAREGAYLAKLPDYAVALEITETTSNFIDFELDMSPFADQEVDYFTIQFIIKSGYIIPGYMGFSKAVIDNLEMVYSPTGISPELSADSDIKVYPNPTSGLINIKSPYNIERIDLYNLYGQQLLSEKNSKRVNIEELPTGTYILKVISNINETYFRKIIKS